MRVRAIAAADERSNAVGTVELECTPLGLVIDYLGVAPFADGYVPATATEGTRVVAPWAAVSEARFEGEQLFLSVAPELTPHSKLVLLNFSMGDGPDHSELYRRRLLVKVFTITLAIVIALVIAGTFPRVAPHITYAAALFIGLLGALGILLLGYATDRRLALGGPSSDSIRGAFGIELARYLPTLVRLPVRPVRPPAERRLPDLQALLPRSTAAVTITLAASGLAAILTGNWLLKENDEPVARRAAAEPAQEPPLAEQRAAAVEPEAAATAAAALAAAEPPPPASPAPASAAPAVEAPVTGDVAQLAGPCRCVRPDSVLWRQPLPRLSVLLIEQRTRRHKDHVHLEIELGIVNNANTSLSDLNFLVQYYEDEPPPSKKRRRMRERPLYYEGPLSPGKAIKWHVEARGTSFEVKNPIEGTISPSGEEAAPADAFAELLNANHRPVRLHGAMMLGYLGDPRAREGALKLREALRENEGPYLDRLVRALSPTHSCQLSSSLQGSIRHVQACLYNSSGEERSGLGVKVRALDRAMDHRNPVALPPLIVSESLWQIPQPLPPESGRIARVSIDTTNQDNLPAEMIELFVDDAQLLE